MLWRGFSPFALWRQPVPHRLRHLLFIALSSVTLMALPLNIGFTANAAQISRDAPPFGLPFSAEPGPETWLIGQQFGNTSSAYNFGRYWYGAGQGLHFGLDFAAPCKTPVLAIGDGIVDNVDNFEFGLLPHNVAIFHPGSDLV